MQFDTKTVEKIKRRSLLKESGCIEWQGCFCVGYGQIYDSKLRKVVGTHRVMYESQGKDIPKGFTVDHLCKNSKCVNPKHLEAVTQEENSRRGSSKLSNTHCFNGHEYSEKNTHFTKKGWRVCRRCRCDAMLRYRYKKINTK